VKLATLGYRQATRSVGELGTPRTYLEWLIDGQPLARLLVDRRVEHPVGLDLLPVLAWGNPDDLARLLVASPPDLPDGRTALLVCPECGDPLCGVASAIVERQGEALQDPVFWPEQGWSLRAKPWVGPFAFDAAAYEQTCRQMLDLGLKPTAIGPE
jgi:hypothetical protein